MFVPILNCSTLISVGFCYLLCMLAIYVFSVCPAVFRSVADRANTYIVNIHNK